MNEGYVDVLHDRPALMKMLCELNLAGDGDEIHVQMLTGGVSSNIFRIDLHSGPVCVKQALPKLKVEKEWHVPTNRVLAEIDWLTTAARIVPGNVPRILGADRVRGAFVMEFLAGLPNWKVELLAGHVEQSVGIQVASVLGQMHQSTASDPSIAREFAHDSNFYALRLEPYLLEAARVHPDLAVQLTRLVETTKSTRLALVHGDISPKNILLRGDSPILLDAECAWYGDPAFDLAFLLNHTLLKSVHVPDCASAFEDLYLNIVATYIQRVSWEDPCGFDERCARLLPGLLLARIDGKSPVEYLTQIDRARIRFAARTLVLQPPSRLGDLLAKWKYALGFPHDVR